MENEARKLLLSLLMISGRSPGVKRSELKAMFGEKLDELIDKVRGMLKPIGLNVEYIPDIDRYVVKTDIPVKDLKTTPLDSNAIAILGIIIILVLARGEAVEKREFLEYATKKVGKVEAKICLGELRKMGYIVEKGEKIYIGWRTETEFDLEELKEKLKKYMLKHRRIKQQKE